MRVLAIPGSLRQASTNRGLLRAARELAPAGMDVEIFDLHGIPLYDVDVEAQGDPERVAALKQAIRDADALLIATPEYNRSIPGVLKNAIDWASRPPLASPFAGKPVVLAGASTGLGGTANAQRHLREALGFPRARVLEEPRLLVASSYEKFDADGDLVDEETRRKLRELLEAVALELGAELALQAA